MPTKDNSPIARAQTSYEKLAAAAKTLNTLSDQLGQTVVELDAALKRLNLGVPTWISFSSWQEGLDWSSDDIGYAKIDGKWGLAIRSMSGNHNYPEEDHTIGEWLFNDAPRVLRLRAVDKIPDLLEALVEDVADFSEKLSVKLKESQRLAAAISGLANKTSQVRKQSNAAPPSCAQDALRQLLASRVPDAPAQEALWKIMDSLVLNAPAQEALGRLLTLIIANVPMPDGSRVPVPRPPTEPGKIDRLEVPPVPGPPPLAGPGKIDHLEVPPVPGLPPLAGPGKIGHSEVPPVPGPPPPAALAKIGRLEAPPVPGPPPPAALAKTGRLEAPPVPGPPPPAAPAKIGRLEVPPIPGPPPSAGPERIGRSEVSPAPTLGGSKMPVAPPPTRRRR